TNVSLDTLILNAPYSWTLAASGTPHVLTLVGSGAIDAQTNSPSTATSFSTGHFISAPISGTVGLTKSGPGVVTLTSTNAAHNFSGGVFINQGTLRITGGDLNLGSAANSLSFNGGSLRVSTAAMSTARSLVFNSGGGSLELFANATFTGNLSGSGALTIANGGGVGTLTALNTGFTGPVSVNVGSLVLGGASGALTNASSYSINGATLTLNNASNKNNRLGASPGLTLNGGHFHNIAGNSSNSTNMNMGALTLDGGSPFITIDAAAGGGYQITTPSVTRNNRAVATIRGSSLGASPGTGNTNFFSTAAPTLVGGGGGPGTNTISIVPWMVGSTAPGSTAAFNLVTYTAGTGFRPIGNAGEYATNLTSGATTNARITTAQTVNSPTTINALNINAAVAGVSGTSVLTVTSGMVMSSSATNVTAFSAGLNFGSAEGVIYTPAAGSLTFSGVISNTSSGGLTKGGRGTMVISGTANTYGGVTTLNSGTILTSGNLPVSTNSAFGNSSAAIVLQSETFGTRWWTTTNMTVDRPITIRGSGGLIALGSSGTTQAITLNGDLQLDHYLQLEGSGAALPIAINGKVSGSGRLTDAFGSVQNLNNSTNDFTGGIEILTGGYGAGADGAFGTGTIWFLGDNTAPAAAGSISAVGGARVLGNAIVFANSLSGTIAGTNDLTINGAVTLGSTNTATINVSNTGQTTFGGVVTNGRLNKSGAGLLILSNSANDYTGGTAVNAGTLAISGDGNLGTIPASTLANSITLNGGTLRGTSSFTLNSKRGITLTAASTIDVTSANNVTYGGTIAGGFALTKQGSGALTLAGTSGYTGTTAINNGTLIVNGTLSSGGGLVSANSGGALGGNGSVQRNSTINSGGFLSPGNSVGDLSIRINAGDSTTTGTLAGGGTYTWESDTVSPKSAPVGTPGSNWDLVRFGKLSITATSGSQFAIKIATLGTFLADFNGNTIYRWKIAEFVTLDNAPNGFDFAKFNVDASAIPLVQRPGVFFLSVSGNDVDLNYVPEPGSVSAILGVTMAILSRRSRARRAPA
ncbi:MAG: beta strand repeat-containing protein, partial [Tepidisphaeraceae bacterium]